MRPQASDADADACIAPADGLPQQRITGICIVPPSRLVQHAVSEHGAWCCVYANSPHWFALKH